MLTEKDKQFVTYWEAVREKRGTAKAKLLSGLPMAILFSAPIMLFITAVYLYFPEWYTKVSDKLPGSLITIVIAVLCCILFYSYFRMHFKWESNEQHYRELKHKALKQENFTEA